MSQENEVDVSVQPEYGTNVVRATIDAPGQPLIVLRMSSEQARQIAAALLRSSDLVETAGCPVQ